MKYIAVLGHGTVGSGVTELFTKNRSSIERKAGMELDIKYILDIRDFPDHPLADRFTKDFEKIVNDPEIAVVVEEKNSYYKEGKTMYIADYNFGYDKEKAEQKDDSPKAIYCETKVNAGESFLLMDGKWIDWHTQWELFKEDDGDMIDNFRIKMFTVDVTA